MSTMMKCCLIVVVIILFSCVHLYIIEYGTNNSTLVLLHVIFRHGDRTPDAWSDYPHNIHKNHTYEPLGFGQLTSKGQTRMYELGQLIRKRYDYFLGKYSTGSVYATSTNFKRTKGSLLSLLAGLYPPAKDQWFHRDVNWQPIPYVYEKPDARLMNVPYLHCANFQKMYYTYLLSEKGQKFIENFKEFFKNISHLTGINLVLPREMGTLYSTLKAQADWGLQMPKWAEQYWERPMEIGAALDYEISTVTAPLVRLAAGHLLRKILDDTKEKIYGNSSKKRKIYLYSGHDFNVATVLRALKVYYRHFPPYGATIFVEIHRTGHDYGLKILYYDYKSPEPKELTMPGCTTICPLQKMEQLFKHHIATPEDKCYEDNEF